MPKSETIAMEFSSGGQPCEFNVDIIDEGLNPLITVKNDELIKLLRWIADRAGYQDRGMVYAQASNAQKSGMFLGLPMHLTVMVSNTPESRGK